MLEQIWDRIELKNAIRTGIAAALSMLIASHLNLILDHPDRLVSGLWCVLSTIVVMQAYLGGSYRIGLGRVLGVICGAIIGSSMTVWLGSNPWNLGIACFVTLVVCCALNIKDSIRIACMTTAGVMILSGLDTTLSPWAFGFYRFFDSVIGIMIGILVVHIIWPAPAAEKMQKKLSAVLKNISELILIVAEMKPTDKQQKEISRRLIENTVDELIQDKNFLNDLQLELKTRLQTIDDWLRLQNITENIFKSIVAIKRVSKLDLGKVIDQELFGVTDSAVRLVSTSLKHEAEKLTHKHTMELKDDLSMMINRLDEELMRFRATKATRQLAFEYVEGFFVYFYHLKFVIHQLQKLQELVIKVTK